MMKEESAMQQKAPIRPTLREMEVGDTASFGTDRYTTLRTSCSELGMVLGRTYSIAVDRDAATCTVTRTK